MMMMMMILCQKAGSLAITPHGDEISEVVSRCLPHKQLWVSNLSKVAMQWLEVDSNRRPFGCKSQNIPLHHRVPCIYVDVSCKHTFIKEVLISASESEQISWKYFNDHTVFKGERGISDCPEEGQSDSDAQ